MKKAVIILLIILLLGVFVFSAWKVWGITREYRAGEVFYEDLEQYVAILETTESRKPDPEDRTPTEAQPEEQETLPWPEVDFDALRQINSDVVGWIYIPDTRVNYPVLQGRNNDQYLYRLMTGEYNAAGSVFLDAAVPPDFSRSNTPIYGHNMKNGSMFADVTGYKGQEFYDAHPYVMLLTPEKNYLVRVFAGYVVSEQGDSWKTEFLEGEFAAWLQAVQQKSYFSPADITPTTRDRIVTLSTCTYETDDVRFVVHGVLEEQ